MGSYRDDFDLAFAEDTAAHAKFLRTVSDLAESGAWRGDGAVDLASWIAARKQVALRTARAWVREAEALKERPALQQALAAGAISGDQCKALTVLCSEGNDDDAHWLEVLPFWSYPELEREARKAKARELERRDGGVYLRMAHTPDERYLRGEFQLHPEDGATFMAAVDARIPGGTKLRDLDHAAALALVEMATDTVVASKRSPRSTVLVSVDDSALTGWARDGAAVAVGGRTGFIPSETARRLACDAATQTLTKDERGNITSIGHTRSDISPATRRAVYERDHGRCTFPGCERDRYLECHHVVPREAGGSHSVDNLVLACWTHHSLVHESGWSLRGDPGPNITWVRPDRRPFEPRVRVTLDTS